MIGDYRFLPCTPAGVMELLKRSGISAAGKDCVVIGRSNIVGKPMAALLMHDNGTETIYDDERQHKNSKSKQAT